MFTVEWALDEGWALELGEYFLHDGPARTAAERRHKQDGRHRRVVTYPGGNEVWRTGEPKKRKQKTIQQGSLV